MFESAVEMAFPVPTLTRICILKIVKDIKEFCPGVNFGDLGKCQFTVGPFEYLCEYQHRSTYMQCSLFHYFNNYSFKMY